MLYLYAITDEAGPSAARSGLRGSPLRAIEADGLFAVASDHDDLHLEATEEDLWAHENVVEKLMEQVSVLPMRLGSMLPDERAVLTLLRDRREEFESTLAHVRGAVELGVRAAIEIESKPAAPRAPAERGPGTAYMIGLLERDRRGAEVAERIHRPLSMLARDSTHRVGEGSHRQGSPPRPILLASYLVDRDRIGRFQARIEELEYGVDNAAITCTGPWPPYSFSSAERER